MDAEVGGWQKRWRWRRYDAIRPEVSQIEEERYW